MVAEGPAAEGPAADSRPYTLANIWLNTRERAKSQPPGLIWKFEGLSARERAYGQAGCHKAVIRVMRV